MRYLLEYENSELLHLQGREAEAQRFIAGLHTQYSRHRNFRAELK